MDSEDRAASRHRWLADAVRSRLLVNVLLVAVAAIAVAAGMFGPLMVRAVAQSTVRQAVARAGADGTSIVASLNVEDENSDPQLKVAATVVDAARQGDGATLWTPAQTWSESTENSAWTVQGSKTDHTSRIKLVDSHCRALLVSGSCPTQDGDATISADTARAASLRVGSGIAIRKLYAGFGPNLAPTPLTVVGIYNADAATVPLLRPDTAAGNDAGVTSDPVIMTQAAGYDLGETLQVYGRVQLRDGLNAQDEPLARASLAAVTDARLAQSYDITLTEGLSSILDHSDTDVSSAKVLVTVTEIQALALAAFALAVVLQRIALTRAAEWGIGRLRGVPRRRWYASIYLEPGVALLIGAVLGFGLGLLAARLAISVGLSTEVPIEPWRWPVLAAAGGVLVVFALALVLVSAPSLRRPLVELIQQRSEVRRLGVVGAVAQSAVVLVAAASLYELRYGGILGSAGSQLGLLAPAFLALAVALIAVRIAVLVVRRVTARPPRSLTALIVGRQTARTPSSLNPALVVAVGTALAVFATQVFFVSVRNQSIRAGSVIGAETVLTVRTPAGTDLAAAVDAADPSGHYALAAQQVSQSTDTGVARILALDTTRLAAVSPGSLGYLDDADIHALRPDDAAPITLEGSRLRLSVADIRFTSGASSGSGNPELMVTLAHGQTWTTVQLGRLKGASRLSAAIPCSAGCRLVDLALLTEQGESYAVDFTITSVRTDVQGTGSATGWLHSNAWHRRVGDQVTADPRAGATPKASTDGLRVSAFDLDGGNLATALPPDAVDPLPALVAPQTGALPYAGIPDTVTGQALDGQTQLLKVVGRPSIIPRLLDVGVLVDLSTAGKLADPSQGARVDQVWLAAGAPTRIEQALATRGIVVTDRQQLSDEVRALDQSPSTRSAAAALDLGLAALVLTLVAFVAARAADVSRRRPDWKSLRDGGLPARAIRRLALIEISVPVVIAVLLGLAGGVAGFVLAAARLPLVDLSTAGPPTELSPAWMPVAAVGVGVLAAVLLIALVAARIETRHGSEQRS